MQTSKHPRPLRRIVLAGPIGSGKSVVASMLSDRGAVVVEADRIGHQVLEPGAPAYPSVAARWPGVVVGGRIERSRLAEVVFADPNALEVLEALTHPHIAARIAAAAELAGDRVFVVELPLLIDLMGSGWPRLVVIAGEDVRYERAVARGMDGADVQRRMAAQAQDEEWVRNAEWVVHNDGDLDALEEAVGDWWDAVVAPSVD